MMIEWKKIPQHQNYSVSEDGKIRNDKKGTIRALAPTQDGYLQMGVRVNGKGYCLYPHKLVCLLFNGEPPSPKHIVNHKDGNKANNYKDNLEWVTHQDNVKHAIETGLTGVNTHVKVINLETDEEMVFTSMSAAAGFFNVIAYQVRQWIRKGTYHLGKYAFFVERSGNRNNHVLGDLLALDMKSRTFYRATGIPGLEVSLNLPEYKIKQALKKQVLVRGVAIWYESDKSIFERMKQWSDEDVAQSIANYREGTMTHLKHVETGELLTFDTVLAAAAFLGLNVETLYSGLRRYPNRTYNGYEIYRHKPTLP